MVTPIRFQYHLKEKNQRCGVCTCAVWVALHSAGFSRLYEFEDGEIFWPGWEQESS